MDNPREDKVAIVTEVKDRLEQSSAVVVTEYRGLTVKALAELRTALRPVGGSYKVYKNTLVRRAASDAGIDLEAHLTGPTALAFTEDTPDGDPGDVVTVAKVLRDFAKTNPDMVIKGGIFDGEPIDAAGVGKLADVEPREVLLSKLAGLMAAPMQQFAGLLQAVPRDFAYGLQALIEKGGSDDAPAASETATSSDEAPSADGAPEVASEDTNETTEETPEAGGAEDAPAEDGAESAEEES
jgi:large subunit ribosomal protein L10